MIDFTMLQPLIDAVAPIEQFYAGLPAIVMVAGALAMVPLYRVLNELRGQGRMFGPVSAKLIFLLSIPTIASIYTASWEVFAILLPGTWLLWFPIWGWALDLNERDSSAGTTGYLWASDDKRWKVWWVGAINRLARGDDYVGFTIRMAFSLPTVLALCLLGLAPWAALMFVPGFAASYAVAYHWGKWKVKIDPNETNVIKWGELYGGAVFGFWFGMALLLWRFEYLGLT